MHNVYGAPYERLFCYSTVNICHLYEFKYDGTEVGRYTYW